MLDTMADLCEAELRIVVAEGVLSRSEADALGEEARRRHQSPLALLVERGRLSDDSFQSLLAEALNEAVWRTTGQDASTSTYTMPGPPSPSGEPAFPVADWDRYTLVRFLGQGGMGKVFLAIDTRLHREVAIKFVRGDDAEHVRRLIAEARTQARVSQERICKIYEVGEVEGKVYIAMQYIAGKPLGSLAGELTLEQKVMLIRGAAEGLHEAHRVGIIHRDIKPSNIMVERDNDGEIRPYIMDFGLAHSTHEAGATLSGAVLGTPRYMAPEQAQGDPAKLDRRADIYSLGATLYHLLTGQPPIPGGTLTEVIHRLMNMEPRRLREIDPNIPIDLEAIVLKCLEKDRSARYDSARALADDLARFLNGEPVRAHPAGAWYRLRKRLAKHRRVVAAAAAAVVLLVAAVGWGIQARGEAAERERLARRFTEMVERIEAIARYSALSPRHDIRGDRAAIRAKMNELDGEIRQAGAVAMGPGHYALGRGYLALDDDAQARAELESAWQHGFREPRVAYALALVMGRLYQQSLLAAERIEDREPREARKRQIEQQYRDPALAYLAASKGAEVPSTEYVAALVAYYEGHLDEALRHIDVSSGGLPWFYEAPELRGDILLARALSFRHLGENERARGDFEAARKAYAAAAAIGESVPAVYTSLGDLEYAALGMELYGHGDVMPPCNRALAATAHALAISPDHYEALVLEAGVQRSLAEYQANQGMNVEGLLAKALGDAERAAAVSPARPQARLEMAQIYRQWGDVRQGRRQDPSEQLRRAVAASEGILPQDRDARYYANLGLIFSQWADYQGQAGVDAEANRGKAIDAYARALQINNRMNEVWINLGIDSFKRASQPHAQDPDGDLRRAIGAFDRARSINPEHVAPYFYEGEIYELMAQRERARGLDPRPDLGRALAAYRGGLVINARIPHLHNGIGAVLMDQAKVAWEAGADPEPLLDQARAAFEQAISVAPEQGFGYDNVGEVLIQRAWVQRARGEDPSASVAAAADMLNWAIERIPDHPTFWADLGMAHAIRAAYDLEHGRDPEPSLARATSAIRTALEKNPRDTQAQLYLGETRGILARFRARQGHGADAEFEQAAQAFQRAIDLAPENQDVQIGFGQFCRAWAGFRRDAAGDPGPPLERGLALADQLLARRPSWPDALVLRGSLLVLAAQVSAGAAGRRKQAASAEQDFSRALTINPALDQAWRGQAALAQQIAAAP
jgi:predicted Ser/Thr protein kinase